MFDIAFNRVPIIDWPALAGRSVHRPATLNLLLTRNLTQERDSPSSYIYRPAQLTVSPQTVLKSAIVFEACGLLDWTCYVLKSFADLIGGTIDIDAAIARLASQIIVSGDASIRQQALRIAGLEQTATAKDLEIGELRKCLDEQALRQFQLEQDLQAVYTSRSWRVTAPLRRLKRAKTISGNR